MAQDLQQYLLTHIPITAAMGVQVVSASREKVILTAPLLANINHKQTVFGGSLHAVATLACWSLLHLNTSKAQIVIANSQIDYIAPVTSDFKAETMRVDPIDLERFKKILQKKGKARIQLSAKIFQENQICVDFTGSFVALAV